MTDLGNFEALKDAHPNALSVSDDGKVVAGYYESNSERRPIIWVKNKPAAESESKPASPAFTPLDRLDSRESLARMAQKDNDLHTLYSGNLNTLATMHRTLENNAYCIGTFAVANRGHHLFNAGIHGALRLAPQWSAGLSLAYLADDTLPGGIESRDRNTPGVGAYLHYAQNPDNSSGLSLTASAAWQEQKLTIRRAKNRNADRVGQRQQQNHRNVARPQGRVWNTPCR